MSYPMVLHDVMGFAAVASALLAAAQKPALRMRLAAVTSNFLFITYGAMGPAYPTLLLHAILLPLNVLHIRAELKGRSRKS
jgi:CRP/FNR family cyclic AMP-dependent transcriptional regulator